MKYTKLTKLEKAIAIGTILSAVTEEELKEYVVLEKLQSFIKQGDVLSGNTTPNEKKEADISLINKLIDSFLEESKSVESDERIQNQTTEA
ncbi:hypothetical protein P4493_15870 [Bacillus thuringiensis]|uniref:Uncharacterized protein n=3 Tax=Bacillus thuringiensis TaxID=1428 RepID=A0AB35P5T7_BACTU|nr:MULTISPECIES: hypothetical protein [Bacillus]MED1154437.1 hypothetical protein [Bacillus paranthracis]AFQ27604.1 hypothetical protein BTF1_17175 [Bacillus thuringiensis HD-789]AJH04510.1 hypothetical protein AS86_73 [Bacillus thuringiensis HD1002]AND25663.1 hypothetical protein ATN07_19490 [Bacillus thuringiensis serovar israelensis]EXL37007.1 hypothetical protein BG78_20545 [Bacillus thuringiensis serovar israelensis]